MNDLDLEKTRLCAKAMELEITYADSEGIFVWDAAKRASTVYAPLHDDAQAMALVKRFPQQCVAAMYCEITHPASEMICINLNRAVVDRVAQVWLACPESVSGTPEKSVKSM